MENEDLHLDFPYEGVLSMPLNYNTIDCKLAFFKFK